MQVRECREGALWVLGPPPFLTPSFALCSLAVVVVPLLDFAFGGKKLGPKALVGCALAVLGVATLEGGGAAAVTLEPGDLATFFQPLAFGVGFWRMEKAMHNHRGAALKVRAENARFRKHNVFLLTHRNS